MNRLTLKLIVTIVTTLLALNGAWAQEFEGELYYLNYKYNQEEDEMLWWLSMEFEGNDIPVKSPEFNRLPNSYYALRNLRYARRGEQSTSHRYVVNGLNLDYSTSRLLSLLNIGRNEEPTTTYYHIKEGQPKYLGYRVRGGITGRNHSASLQFNSRNLISKHGVALNEDWEISSALRVMAGPDFYIEGVSRNGFEAAVSAYRTQLNNTLFFALMIPWSKRGLRQYSTEEAFSLTDNRYYNPTWGMLNGEKRNSRLVTSFTPEAIGVWEHKLSAWTVMTITTRLKFERNARTALGWYDADTPMPDNYRYMPSYFGDADNQMVTEAWKHNDIRYTQINWDDILRTNMLQGDGPAAYAIESRVSNSLLLDGSLLFRTQLRGIDLSYGLTIDANTEHRFKLIDDMLGGDHILNIDYFIVDDATYGSAYRNNLRSEQLEVYEGDKFGYNYRLTSYRAALFAKALFNTGSVDFDIRARLATEGFRRRGYFEKELFSGRASLGRSRSTTFYPAVISLRARYNVENHMFNLGFKAESLSPNVDAQYLQPDYNNRLVDDLRSAVSLHANAEYQLTLQRLRLSASLFASHHTRGSDVVRYYDDLVGEYCDAVISNLTHTNYGVELDLSAQWSRYLSSTLSLTAARYRYSKDAQVATYSDKSNTLLATSTSAMRGLTTGYPEITAYGDITFRRSGWQATLSAQYWGSRHVTPSPIRHSERIVKYAQSAEERSAIQAQQRLKDAAMLNINVGKSFNLKSDVRLRVSLSVDNLLGSKIVYGGYEQHRTRHIQNGYYTSVAPFANKICYAYGRTFRLNIGLTI